MFYNNSNLMLHTGNSLLNHGPVMLTAKNLQCMRALLVLAHCHGSILGSSWHLVLTTLQVVYLIYFGYILNRFK